MKKIIFPILLFLSVKLYSASDELVFKGMGLQGKDVRLTLVRGDITQQEDADFIVNAANSTLLGGGGVDGAIHEAAGSELKKWIKENIKEIKPGIRLKTGDAEWTPAFNLEKNGIYTIIHTVGPDCRINEQNKNRELLLSSAYRNCLQKAHRMACIVNWGCGLLLPGENSNEKFNREKVKVVAFPSISTAIYSYPIKEAAQVAIETVGSVIKQGNFALQEVRFVLFSDNDLKVYQQALKEMAK